MEKKHCNEPSVSKGYEFVNKQGCKAKVVDYFNNKAVHVKFEDNDTVIKTTAAYIRNGLPLHPTFGKVKVGDRFPCKDGDTVEVLEYVSSTQVRCKWLSDGAEKWTEVGTLRKGLNKHPSNWKFEAGQKVQTKNNGVIEVLEYRSAIDIIIRFENGEEKSVTAQDLRAGHVRPDSKFISRVGHKFTTNSGWYGEVVEWNNANNVKVLWQDGSESTTSWADIKGGNIKPLFQPSVCGIGYVGDGRFIPHSYKKLQESKEYAPDVLYAYWLRMITRCYNEKEQAKPSSRAYIGCTVDSEWHNFQNFAEWALSNPYYGKLDKEGKIWHLDKDIIEIGNRVYCASSCLFVPNEINTFFSSTEIGNTGYLGVNYIKPATKGAKEGYIARCHSEGVRQYLGYYNTALEAYLAYREAKIKVAKDLAKKWNGQVDDRVTEALLKFEERLPTTL